MVFVAVAPCVGASFLRKGIDAAVEEKIIKERLKLFQVEGLIKKLKSEAVNAGTVDKSVGSRQVHHGMKLHSSSSRGKHAKTRFSHQASLQKNIEDSPSKAAPQPAASGKPQGDGVPYIAGGEFENSGDGFDSALAKPTFGQMVDPLTTRL